MQNLQKLIIEKNITREAHASRFLIGLISVAVFLAIIKVILANWLIESSETLRNLDLKIAQHTAKVQSLSENVRDEESLSRIEQKALALGFTSTNNVTFISPSPTFALRPSDVSNLR